MTSVKEKSEVEKLEEAAYEGVVATSSSLQDYIKDYPINPPKNEKAYQFFREVLKAPKKICAPMVDASELPFRMLVRKYGADAAWSPMFHARLFATCEDYRDIIFSTCPEDRPLVIQFCANDPNYLVQAAEHIYDKCDAICLNLGCPQEIARRGHYGAFLSDKDPMTVEKIVRTASKEFKVPIVCKMRLKKTLEESIAFAKMLEAAGCQLLTVHGRTKEMRGRNQGLADWEAIRRIKEVMCIPVIANGNIQVYDDIEKCLEYTKCEGVMSADALLFNPAFFSGIPLDQQPNKLSLAREYFEMCREYPTTPAIMRGHLFKILKEILAVHTDIREKLAEVMPMEGFENLIIELEKRAVDTSLKPVNEALEKLKKEREEKKRLQEQEEEEVCLGGFF